jgi:hypothetical protein
MNVIRVQTWRRTATLKAEVSLGGEHYWKHSVPALSLTEDSVIFCIRLLSSMLTLLNTWFPGIRLRVRIKHSTRKTYEVHHVFQTLVLHIPRFVQAFDLT